MTYKYISESEAKRLYKKVDPTEDQQGYHYWLAKEGITTNERKKITRYFMSKEAYDKYPIFQSILTGIVYYVIKHNMLVDSSDEDIDNYIKVVFRNFNMDYCITSLCELDLPPEVRELILFNFINEIRFLEEKGMIGIVSAEGKKFLQEVLQEQGERIKYNLSGEDVDA
jgi:hypothetical protein